MQTFESGSIKRFFRAKRKINATGLVSHITQRAAGREPLFIEDDDYLFMIWLLKDISEKHNIEFFAFCLMPNHIHLLLRPEEENLYDAMRDLFSRYAVRFNRRYERKGHLFGGPYRQAICLDDTYLLTASLYIHLNPVKVGLCKHPIEYLWSSVKLYCPDPPIAFVKPDFILRLLSDKVDISECHKMYLDLLKRGVKFPIEHVLEQEDAINRFRKKLIEILPSLFRSIAQSNASLQSAGLDLMDILNLEKEIERFKNEKLSRSTTSKKAKKYVIEQLLARGYKRYEIAVKLDVSEKTIYNLLKLPD